MRGHENRHFIYFATVADGSIKIGCSTNVTKRVKTLRADLLHVIEGSTFRENALHFLLRDSCVGGEHFAYSGQVREFIEAAKSGNYSGLISDLPRVPLYLMPDPVKYKANVVRPFRAVREALGISHRQVSDEVGIAMSSATSADSQTAPFHLSGRLAQYIIGKARERGYFVDSHHLTGLYTAELKALLPKRHSNIQASSRAA